MNNTNTTVPSAGSRLTPPYPYLVIGQIASWLYVKSGNLLGFGSAPFSDAVNRPCDTNYVVDNDLNHPNNNFKAYENSDSGNQQNNHSYEFQGINIPGWKGMPTRSSVNGDYSSLSLDGNLMLSRLAMGLWNNRSAYVDSEGQDTKMLTKSEYQERCICLRGRWNALNKYIVHVRANLDETDKHIAEVTRELRRDLEHELKKSAGNPIPENIFEGLEADTKILEELLPVNQDIFSEQYVRKYENYRHILAGFTQEMPEKPYPQKTVHAIHNILIHLKKLEQWPVTQFEADQLLDTYHSTIGWVQKRHPARWSDFNSTLPDFTKFAQDFERQMRIVNNTPTNRIDIFSTSAFVPEVNHNASLLSDTVHQNGNSVQLF